MYNNELYHYGVKGMKWGRRKARNHAGPGRYMGSTKRRIQGHKNDLATLDRGEHLSVGLTKKRQAKFDARDRKAIENQISKHEAKREKSTKQLSRSKNECKRIAVDALDRLDTHLFFNGDNVKNNFAVRAGIREVRDGIESGQGIYDTAVSALDKYNFFKD